MLLQAGATVVLRAACFGNGGAVQLQRPFLQQCNAKGMQPQRFSKTSNRALSRCRALPMQPFFVVPRTCHCGSVLMQGSTVL